MPKFQNQNAGQPAQRALGGLLHERSEEAPGVEATGGSDPTSFVGLEWVSPLDL